MAYKIYHTNNNLYANIPEAGMDEGKIGITLIGRNFGSLTTDDPDRQGYGVIIAENFLHMLEHHANNVPPENSVEGQLWWDSTNKVLKVSQDAIINEWRIVGGPIVRTTPPGTLTGELVPVTGDLWLDSTLDQLKIYTGSLDGWKIIGPQYPKGQSVTGLLPIIVQDEFSSSHIIGDLRVNGHSVAIVNGTDGFNLLTSLHGLTAVGNGFTLIANSMITGTSLNSLQLGGEVASQFLNKTRISNTLTGSLIVQGFEGVKLGNLSLLETGITSTNANITISANNSAITLINDAILISKEPTQTSSITTKYYVDNLVSITDTSARLYTDSRISSVIASSPLPTLAALSTAINNDANYFNTVNAALNLKATKISPALSGIPTAPTAGYGDSSTQIATTNFVKTVLQTSVNGLEQTITNYAPILNPTFTGTPRAPNPDPSDYSTRLATTAFVRELVNGDLTNFAPIANPTFTGTPRAPTPLIGDSSTQLATTAFVNNLTSSGFAPIANPTFTGTPRAPTPSLGNATTQLATTEFVTNTVNVLGNTLTNSTIIIGSTTIDVNGSTSILDGLTSVTATNFYGRASSASYADLAENYISDNVYEVGTVVVFGGPFEISISDIPCDTRVAGIVSENPAYLMNNESPGLPIALTGKVLCKVTGIIRKGDVLVNSNIPGVATALKSTGKWAPGCVIGKALAENEQTGIQVIMIAVGRF